MLYLDLIAFSNHIQASSYICSLSIAYFYLNNKELSLKNVELALELDKKNDRIINNKILIENLDKC